MISSIAKLLSILNSETEPSQISLGFAFSMVAGLTPFFGLHNLVVLFLALVLRVNLSAFFLGTVFFSALAYGLDPLFHSIGLKVLTWEAARGVWTNMYNMAIMRVARFNNTIFMGSFILSAALFAPFVLVMNLLIRKYRKHILAYVEKTRIVQAWKATGMYRMYRSYRDLRSSL
jgi:uncharacterized protein (TIGR03546 family)